MHVRAQRSGEDWHHTTQRRLRLTAALCICRTGFARRFGRSRNRFDGDTGIGLALGVQSLRLSQRLGGERLSGALARVPHSARQAMVFVGQNTQIALLLGVEIGAQNGRVLCTHTALVGFANRREGGRRKGERRTCPCGTTLM
jgi:hypothetical protein